MHSDKEIVEGSQAMFAVLFVCRR